MRRQDFYFFFSKNVAEHFRIIAQLLKQTINESSVNLRRKKIKPSNDEIFAETVWPKDDL